jgi:hypothetical protein
MCGAIGNRLGNMWELNEHIRSIVGNLGNLVVEEDGNIKIQNKSPPNPQSCSHYVPTPYVPTPQQPKKRIGPSSVQVEPSHWLHETFILKTVSHPFWPWLKTLPKSMGIYLSLMLFKLHAATFNLCNYFCDLL